MLKKFVQSDVVPIKTPYDSNMHLKKTTIESIYSYNTLKYREFNVLNKLY